MCHYKYLSKFKNGKTYMTNFETEKCHVPEKKIILTFTFWHILVKLLKHKDKGENIYVAIQTGKNVTDKEKLEVAETVTVCIGQLNLDITFTRCI